MANQASSRVKPSASPGGVRRRTAGRFAVLRGQLSASPSSEGDIELYLNFDMIAGRTSCRFVSTVTARRSGSRAHRERAIEDVFEAFSPPGAVDQPTAFRRTVGLRRLHHRRIPAGDVHRRRGVKTPRTPRSTAACRRGGCATTRATPGLRQPDPIADGADAWLYEALDEAYEDALQ